MSEFAHTEMSNDRPHARQRWRHYAQIFIDIPKSSKTTREFSLCRTPIGRTFFNAGLNSPFHLAAFSLFSKSYGFESLVTCCPENILWECVPFRRSRWCWSRWRWRQRDGEDVPDLEGDDNANDLHLSTGLCPTRNSVRERFAAVGTRQSSSTVNYALQHRLRLHFSNLRIACVPKDIATMRNCSLPRDDPDGGGGRDAASMNRARQQPSKHAFPRKSANFPRRQSTQLSFDSHFLAHWLVCDWTRRSPRRCFTLPLIFHLAISHYSRRTCGWISLMR